MTDEKLASEDQAYYAEAIARKQGADAIYAFVSAVLQSRYALQPGDQITPDGTIIRLRSLEQVVKEDGSDGTV